MECDAGGARVAGVPLLVKLERGGWRTRPKADIEAALSSIFDVPIEASAKMRGIGIVAEALNAGELARAQIATLLLQIPDPVEVDRERGLQKAALLWESGWLHKDWDPSKHPRTGTPPNPGWFGPTDGGAGSAKPVDASNPKPSSGSESPEIKPAPAATGATGDARIIPVAGGEEDERFPWEERDDEEGGIYYNEDTGKMITLPAGSGVVLRSPWIRLPDLGQTYLSAPATQTWAATSPLDEHYDKHADDFGAKDEEDYAAKANEFFWRLKAKAIAEKSNPMEPNTYMTRKRTPLGCIQSMEKRLLSSNRLPSAIGMSSRDLS